MLIFLALFIQGISLLYLALLEMKSCAEEYQCSIGTDNTVSEAETYQDVEILQNHGINVVDLRKLKSSGICTVKGVYMTTKKKLLSIKGISEAKADKIKEAAAKVFNHTFSTAYEFCEARKQIFRVSTGSEELNKLMGGGLESMSITEVFGGNIMMTYFAEYRTGKTQLSHTLCVTVQTPTSIYPGGKVIFIDTENTL
ncbi:hypothetical protein HZS_7740 [Henneguya salminicola]|nr:hypothetical protein HZS_7740 [Henneguya salminicola]